LDSIDLVLRITPLQAAQIVETEIVNGAFSAELVDKYYTYGNSGECYVLVFEKYFMRTSSRASLTVFITNISGVTRVHAVGSGGGQGTFLSFDWGAASSFAGNVAAALEQYQ